MIEDNKKRIREIGERRLFEDIAITCFILIVFLVIPYTDSYFSRISGNYWKIIGHFLGIVCLITITITGMRLANKFRNYWLWGWRETFAVIFLCLYSGMGLLVMPKEPILKQSVWLVCILIQSSVLACALYLEAWFHGKQGHEGSIESRKLANQACWHIFAASWTALAASIIVAGIVINLGGSWKMEGELKGQNDIIHIVMYLILTVWTDFLWIMRPCFQKSSRIISELHTLDEPDGKG